ncbi:Flp family type IVb pilin [Micromonospora soli]|uniref:Flp family type IVb pilin n=1 Tax=Micromonospora sp. NBRC 110009 TaxID=3061627 RepID=UPI0026739D83|nr:Flp family type IVb pilin [Micromonospora sp. NBRC 110009]WKU01102.1 Flp family type IVb pilin [Micromonospora sp. NBRC 110009]
MSDVISRIKSWFKRDDRGASAVEYALIVALVAGVIGGLVYVLGSRSGDMFQRACKELTTGSAPSNCTPRGTTQGQ